MEEVDELSMPPHQVALSHVLGRVREREAVSSAYIAEVLHRSGSEISSYRAAMECVRLHARVAIHFHPDRLGTKRVPVAQALLQEGVYRNQFETGLSTGGLSAFHGGARDGWERSLFGGAYHAGGVSDSARPKYGAPRKEPADLPTGRVLDTQIEAQVHGPVELEKDVELLVADPAFAHTGTGEILRAIAARYGLPLRWHRGFRLSAVDVPDDFRGPAMPRLARRIAGENGMIDAAAIGNAEASLHHHPEAWRDWGSREEVLQHFKQLWHVLVHYGRGDE